MTIALVGGCAGAEPVRRDTFERDPALDAVELISSLGTSSHEAGSNCMACHGPNGDGPGAFQVAATVWKGAHDHGHTDHGDTDHEDTDAGGEHDIIPSDPLEPLAGATVQLRTGPFGTGDLLLEVVTDDAGNFYSTGAVDWFSTAVFPTVLGIGGEHSLGMPFPTGSGACNVCHGKDGAKMLYLE